MNEDRLEKLKEFIKNNKIGFFRFNDEIIMKIGNNELLWFQRNGHHVYLTTEAFLEEASKLDLRRV